MTDLKTLIDRLGGAEEEVTAEDARLLVESMGPWEAGSEEHKLFCLACTDGMESIGAAIELARRTLGESDHDITFDRSSEDDGTILTHVTISTKGRLAHFACQRSGVAIVVALLGILLEMEEDDGEDEVDREAVEALARTLNEAAHGHDTEVVIYAATSLISAAIFDAATTVGDAIAAAQDAAGIIHETIIDNWDDAKAPGEDEIRDALADIDDAPPSGRLH